MPIEMPKGLPFSVDTWTRVSRRKRHHFLTHAHKDHLQGIPTYASYPIFSTVLTKTLVLLHFPQVDDSLFVAIEVGESVLVHDPEGDFRVTALDANHCPGSVMFLFEGRFGSILHSGDCRLTAECLQGLPEKYISWKGNKPRCQLDYIFLDCTFGRFRQKMPSRRSAVQEVINCIWKHPDAPAVYLPCDLLGQEEILMAVCQTFGCKIYVDKEKNPVGFQVLQLVVPEILSNDPLSRFQLFDGFPKLYERAEGKIAEAHSNLQHEPLIIRPSAQWYACGEGSSEIKRWKKERFGQAVRDSYGVWHVCYSIHSAKDELEWALQLIAPKWVVSTTPPNRAMELDYVKEHYSRSSRDFDETFKLVDVTVSSASDELLRMVSPKKLESLDRFSAISSAEASFSGETPYEEVESYTGQRRLLNLSPDGKSQSITLFGKARFGHQESDCEKMHELRESTSDLTRRRIPDTLDDTSSEGRDDCKKPMGTDIDETIFSSTETRIKTQKTFNSPISLSKNTRKYYRSMHLPVSQALPTLVELMNANKRARRLF